VVATAVLIGWRVQASGTATGRAFGWAPLRWVGSISYRLNRSSPAATLEGWEPTDVTARPMGTAAAAGDAGEGGWSPPFMGMQGNLY